MSPFTNKEIQEIEKLPPALVVRVEQSVRKGLSVRHNTGTATSCSLAELGVTTRKDGVLVCDAQRLQANLSNNPEVVIDYLADTGGPVESIHQFLGSLHSAGGGLALQVAQLQREMHKLAVARGSLKKRQAQLYDATVREYTNMENEVARSHQARESIRAMLASNRRGRSEGQQG